jgi:hypothetical protein
MAKQLSVTLPNKPGQLAALCKKLAAKKVNITAISVIDTAELGVVRMVVDKSAIARRTLKEAALSHVVTDVVLVEMTNRPGVMATAASDLAKAGVNIEYVYGTASPGAETAVCVFGVDDVKKAKKII